MMDGLRWLNLVLAALAVMGPMAHVLELRNKLMLVGPLWLAVQQSLYRGWGRAFGPIEIAALATTVILAVLRRRNGPALGPTAVAAIAYAGMLVVFFVFNYPANHAFAAWTTATLPDDWRSYRLRWEMGHAVAALLAIVGFVAVARAWIVERYGRA